MTANRPNISHKKDTLICIGEGVHLSGESLHMVADLFLSPDGSILWQSTAPPGTHRLYPHSYLASVSPVWT